ncbi:unnamed protein product [Durusdinium trenchii]|uniref:Uncharacterized protein n=2 Tax=Durusdinium trenchii TaxID=1381693 RepID=A0ABP0LPT4_9DINO
MDAITRGGLGGAIWTAILLVTHPPGLLASTVRTAVTAVDWLDCRGAAFAPQWSELALLSGLPEQIRPLPPPIVKLIEELEPSCQARKDVASLLAWTGEKPEADYEAMDSLRWWINASYEVTVKEGHAFCLYGCITVLFLLAFNELAWLMNSAAEPSEAEAEQSLQYIFVSLHYARSLLGDHSTLDLVSSSVWPANLPGKIKELFLKTEEVITGTPPPAVAETPPTALDLARRWQPCDPLLHQGCWPAGPARAQRWARGDGAALVMLFIGEHAPFANTVWQCISSAAMALSVSLRPIFAGAFYACQGLPSACENDVAKDWFRAWMTRWPLESDEALQVADMDSEAMGLMKAIQGHPDPDASRPDFLLCGDTVLFCHLLRRAGFFRDIPALHMYGMVFLQYVPVSWRTTMMQDFADFWKTLGVHEPAGVNIEVLGLQLQWQMGIAIPFVPSSGTSDSAGVLYQPPGGAEATANAAAAAAPSTAQRRVVLLKSGFFALAPGRVFDVVLRRLTHDVHDGTKRPSGATGRTTWHFWGTETTKVFLNFATMASYSCAVYVAPEFSQLLLRDVYGIGLPVLAPEILWHQRLLQHMFASWGQLHNEHDVGRRPPESKQQDQAAVFHAADTWKFPPFYNPLEHPPEHLKFWLPLAEVHRWPHVVPFASLTELLRLVETVDLRAVSARMQVESRRIAANCRSFYRQSLLHLINQRVSTTNS